MRASLLRVAAVLPLQATPETEGLLRLVAIAAADEPPYFDYLSTDIPPAILIHRNLGEIFDPVPKVDAKR
jgi:hypothetical protein